MYIIIYNWGVYIYISIFPLTKRGDALVLFASVLGTGRGDWLERVATKK
jgi:hypothetical protein